MSSSYLHLSSDIDKLKDKNEYLEKKIESINREHDITFLNLKRNYENLEREDQYRKEMQQREEQKINNFKVAFENSKKNIEKINLEKSKEYIIKWIINKFVKEFDNEEGKKNSFTISLIEFMKDLNKEYMEYCSKFISSFKANGQKIVNDFNIKDNKILIEHINFIVIGKAGVGKSTFINESLLLSREKNAEEGIGKSKTRNQKYMNQIN